MYESKRDKKEIKTAWLMMQCGCLHDLAEIADEKQEPMLAKQIRTVQGNLEKLLEEVKKTK